MTQQTFRKTIYLWFRIFPFFLFIDNFFNEFSKICWVKLWSPMTLNKPPNKCWLNKLTTNFKTRQNTYLTSNTSTTIFIPCEKTATKWYFNPYWLSDNFKLSLKSKAFILGHHRSKLANIQMSRVFKATNDYSERCRTVSSMGQQQFGNIWILF